MIPERLREIVVSVILLAFILPDLMLAQSNSEGLTPMQVAKMKQVNEIAVDSSGDQAIYTLRKQADPTEKNEPASYDLYLADLSNDSTAPFVTTMSVSNIAFRPNNNSITFLGSRNDEQTSLYEISLDGGEAQKIFAFHTPIAAYSWAPDGSHLAFMAQDTIVHERSPLPYHPEIYEENLKQRRGYVTNIDKGDHEPHQLQVEGSIYQMQWSPDGERLAIAVAPTPLVDDFYMHQQVNVVDHKGNVLSEIDHQGKLGDIRWSPNGEQLAIIAGADINDPIAGRLFVVSSDGGEPTQLQPHYEGMFEQVKWSGNDTLHYLSSEGVWSTYGSISSDGTNMKPIVDRGDIIISEFTRASDNATIFTGSSPSHPQELFRLDSESDELVRITNSNLWLDDIEFGQQEAVTWTAEDGTELQGILVYPTDFEEGQEYPLITTVHGGPESHYNHGWVTNYSDPGQVGAAEGYFVFYPNYRGSTGRGENFAKSSQGDLAGAEFDDIVAGVDELIDVGLVDSAKVGVTGGSYGGYATGWMSTRYTDRFAAGVMFVGISNNISKWGTSDIPEELYLVHARERIWEDYQDFLERSPIYHAGQAETPLLIMAGKEDTRVDPGQSYELYRHIKTRTDTPVRLVLYPEEGHGNVNATARYDYNLRMMRWFNKYLQGEGETKPDVELELESEAVEN